MIIEEIRVVFLFRILNRFMPSLSPSLKVTSVKA